MRATRLAKKEQGRPPKAVVPSRLVGSVPPKHVVQGSPCADTQREEDEEDPKRTKMNGSRSISSCFGTRSIVIIWIGTRLLGACRRSIGLFLSVVVVQGKPSFMVLAPCPRSIMMLDGCRCRRLIKLNIIGDSAA